MLPDDAGKNQRYVGNCLLIIKQLPPLRILHDANVNDGNTAKTVELPADRYRFHFYYLSKNTARNFRKSGSVLDLVESRTVDYADYDQIKIILDAYATKTRTQDQKDFNKFLRDNGMTQAWKSSATTLSDSFWDVKTDGTSTKAASQVVTLKKSATMLPMLSGGRITSKMDYSVAFRPSATTQYALRDPIPKWAVWNSAKPLYPSGFEVKIIGGGSNQRLLTRLVLMANYSGSKFHSREALLLTSIRDTLVR